jgi:hypothetical protein
MLPVLKYDDSLFMVGIGLVFQPDFINNFGGGINSACNEQESNSRNDGNYQIFFTHNFDLPP